MRELLCIDVSAKLTKRMKMKGATPLTTSYNRDLLSRIKTVLDPQGNKWPMATMPTAV